MAVISFQLAESADSSHRERVLDQLRHTHGVRHAGRIDPASQDGDVARMCFADTIDTDATNAVVETLRGSAGVENVAVEPRRGLVG